MKWICYFFSTFAPANSRHAESFRRDGVAAGGSNYILRSVC